MTNVCFFSSLLFLATHSVIRPSEWSLSFEEELNYSVMMFVGFAWGRNATVARYYSSLGLCMCTDLLIRHRQWMASKKHTVGPKDSYASGLGYNLNL